jgi:hypothetical protein
MHPRQISPRKALAYREKATAAAVRGFDFRAEKIDAEIDQVKLHQQRRTLEHLAIGDQPPLWPTWTFRSASA